MNLVGAIMVEMTSAERDEFLYMMPVGDVMVPVYDKPCLV